MWALSSTAFVNVWMAGSHEFNVDLVGHGSRDVLATTVLFTLGITQSSSIFVANLTSAALVSGEYDIQVTKRTEAMFGIVSLYAAGVTALTAADSASHQAPLCVSDTAPHKALRGQDPGSVRRIEFIGDSLTAGYGVLGVSPCRFSAPTEDVMSAYAAVAVQSIGALRCFE